VSRHEIDIEGLGKDLEPVKWGRVSIGDSYLSPKGHLIKNSQSPPSDMRLIVRRKVRKYDHSKTLDDVPVELVGRTGIFTLKIIADGYGDLEAETAALKEENERLRWQLCKSETDI
jgi:hypothetical protein